MCTARAVITTKPRRHCFRNGDPRVAIFYWLMLPNIDQQVSAACRCPTIGVAIWY